MPERRRLHAVVDDRRAHRRVAETRARVVASSSSLFGALSLPFNAAADEPTSRRSCTAQQAPRPPTHHRHRPPALPVNSPRERRGSVRHAAVGGAARHAAAPAERRLLVEVAKRLAGRRRDGRVAPRALLAREATLQPNHRVMKSLLSHNSAYHRSYSVVIIVSLLSFES